MADEVHKEVTAIKQAVMEELTEKISDGESLVRLVGWLVKEKRYNLAQSEILINEVLEMKARSVPDTYYIAQYRMMGEKLFKQCIADGDKKTAASVLANLTRLQQAEQTYQMKKAYLLQRESELSTKVQIIKGEIAPPEEKMKELPQPGFTIQVEGFQTQSTSPKGLIDVTEAPCPDEDE